MTPDDIVSACNAAGIKPVSFPDVLDNTILSTWRTCPHQAFRAYFQRLKPPGINPDLHFGSAYATGLETMRNAFYLHGKSESEAWAAGCLAATQLFGDFEPPTYRDGTPRNKTWHRLFEALDVYRTTWPLGADKIQPLFFGNVPSVEYSFASPIPSTDGHVFAHPDTGNPLLYAGKLDLLGTLLGGQVAPVDDKTATRDTQVLWRLRSQFHGYVEELHQRGLRCDTFFVRRMVILKWECKPLQELVPIPPHMVERWKALRIDTINEMLSRWAYFKHLLVEDPEHLPAAFPYVFNDACNAFGGCDFADLCTSPTPDQIESAFEHNDWTPLSGLSLEHS